VAHILIDDEEPIRMLIQQALEGAGHHVSNAPGVREGLSLLYQVPTDLVILDILMPDGDGFEAIQILTREFPRTRILAISGGGGMMEHLDLLGVAKKFGAHDALDKPFELSTLLDRVEIALAEGSARP
jgi:DNA-binding response OmpR family regulator